MCYSQNMETAEETKHPQENPTMHVKKGAKEVVFKTVKTHSVNEEDVEYLLFKKEGGFKMINMYNARDYALETSALPCPPFAYWGFKDPLHSFEWAADEENWEEVVRLINAGDTKVVSVVSR